VRSNEVKAKCIVMCERITFSNKFNSCTSKQNFFLVTNCHGPRLAKKEIRDSFGKNVLFRIFHGPMKSMVHFCQF